MPPKHLTLAILFLAFTAHSGDSTITYANKTYKTAKIGTQTWLAENLNYEAEGSKCYENNPANCAKYGQLYNWETAKKVCPKGWHLPSNAEWDELYRFVDCDTGTERLYRGETAGKHLKAASSWNENGNGTDKYGFFALPGGVGYSDGSFDYAGSIGYWWSTSEGEHYSGGAYLRFMLCDSDGAYWNIDFKNYLFSVRCLQD